MLLGPVRSFSRSRFLISSILDPFRLNFCFLGRPLCCVSGRQALYFWKEENVVLLSNENFSMSGGQRLLLFSTRRLVSLQDRDCCCSQQEKPSPNPSYLHSGEFVLPWDPKNRSSHTQIIHIEFLRAQIYLKSAETEGTPPIRAYGYFCQKYTFGPERPDSQPYA